MTNNISDNLVKALMQVGETNAYYESIGRFIERFSFAEACIFLLLAKSANTTIPVAKAVFSGVRTEQTIGYMYRIWRVQPPKEEIRSELTAVFTQMKAINKLRNLLIHYGTDPLSEGKRITSNALRALTAEDADSSEITLELMEKLSGDLSKISKHLISIFKSPDTTINERAKYYPELLDAWLYIPPSNQKKAQKKLD